LAGYSALPWTPAPHAKQECSARYLDENRPIFAADQSERRSPIHQNSGQHHTHHCYNFGKQILRRKVPNHSS
jgi:hypothetical protein